MVYCVAKTKDDPSLTGSNPGTGVDQNEFSYVTFVRRIKDPAGVSVPNIVREYAVERG